MKLRKSRNITVGAFMLLIVAAAGFSMANDEVRTEKEKLMKSFPNLKVDGFRESPLKGLYEITAGEQVFYFNPEGYLFFGEIWTKDGKNLTAEMREKVAADRIKDLPLDKALKIGTGPRKVIEFTDPDCPYCRKVDSFLAKRTDVTRYVYFVPLRRISTLMPKRRPVTSCLMLTGRKLSMRYSEGSWMANQYLSPKESSSRNWRRWKNLRQDLAYEVHRHSGSTVLM